MAKADVDARKARRRKRKKAKKAGKPVPPKKTRASVAEQSEWADLASTPEGDDAALAERVPVQEAAPESLEVDDAADEGGAGVSSGDEGKADPDKGDIGASGEPASSSSEPVGDAADDDDDESGARADEDTPAPSALSREERVQRALEQAAAAEHPDRAHVERDPRSLVETSVSVHGTFTGRVREERIVNLSQSGAFIETTDVLDEGDAVVISVPVPGETQPLTLSGRVRWVDPFGTLTDARPGMGIAFVGLDDERRKRLARVLEGAG